MEQVPEHCTFHVESFGEEVLDLAGGGRLVTPGRNSRLVNTRNGIMNRGTIASTTKTALTLMLPSVTTAGTSSTP
jgi:hypothetical protein